MAQRSLPHHVRGCVKAEAEPAAEPRNNELFASALMKKAIAHVQADLSRKCWRIQRGWMLSFGLFPGESPSRWRFSESHGEEIKLVD